VSPPPHTDVVVFLMSLKAGGVALNLTAARCVRAGLQHQDVSTACSLRLIEHTGVSGGVACSLWLVFVVLCIFLYISSALS
jgi:hypothetical protein